MPLFGLPDISTASFLRDRRVPPAAAAQVGAVWAGVGGCWPCTVRCATGLPCPGCGLTRGAVALARGGWGESLAAHAFAPVLMAFLAACALAAPLPRRRREAFAGLVGRVERHTRASAFLLLRHPEHRPQPRRGRDGGVFRHEPDRRRPVTNASRRTDMDGG